MKYCWLYLYHKNIDENMRHVIYINLMVNFKQILIKICVETMKIYFYLNCNIYEINDRIEWYDSLLIVIHQM